MIPPLPPPTKTNSSIVDLDRVPLGSEHGLATQRRLSTGANALQELLVGQPLALGEVGEEQVDVSAEAVDLLAAGRHEREDRHGAVGALVHVPGVAGDGGAADGDWLAFGVVVADESVSNAIRSRRKDSPEKIKNEENSPRNRPSIDVSQPNHQLKLLRATRRIAREQIIRHIGNQPRAGVRPTPSRRDALDLGKRDVLGLDDDVGVRFDVVLAAGPAPGAVPFDGRAAAAVECGALAAGGCAALAPEVVVEGVVLDGDVVPVAAHFGGAGEEGGGARRQGGGEGGGEDGEFHGRGWIDVCEG